MYLPVSINIAIFVVLLYFLWIFKKKTWSLSSKVFLGLIIGVIYGFALHAFYGLDNPALTKSIEWFNIVGNGYVSLLKMIIMPLVFVSILSAVTRLHQASSLGKISFLTIGILLFTTAIAAIIAVIVTNIFGLTSAGLTEGVAETARLAQLNDYSLQLNDMTPPQMILSFIPQNPFSALSGGSPTSIISVVIFAAFLGAAALRLIKDDQAKGEKLIYAVDLLQSWIMKLVRSVIALTPYGVMALMIKVMSTSDFDDILKLGTFVIASYVALALMFIVHGILLGTAGINPIQYFKNAIPTLVFAFTSRSSAATIPLNIETQVKKFGVPQSIASFSASFGATIGQNGCAGIYPAMLAVMIAPTMGVDPTNIFWILKLVAFITISSIGVAGVGGGATFAALIVLPLLGFPITLVALLISIEPLIDMGRTALNVNGSMTAGTLTSKILRQTDKTVLEQSAH